MWLQFADISIFATRNRWNLQKDFFMISDFDPAGAMASQVQIYDENGTSVYLNLLALQQRTYEKKNKISSFIFSYSAKNQWLIDCWAEKWPDNIDNLAQGKKLNLRQTLLNNLSLLWLELTFKLRSIGNFHIFFEILKI